METGVDFRLQDIDPYLPIAAESHDQFIRYHAEHKEVDGFQKIHFAPQDRSRYWLLTLHVPEKVVFAEVDAALNTMLLVGLAISLISLILIVWFVSIKMLAPVVNLATAASRLQDGDLSVRVDEAFVHDEFRTLYAAINAFAINQKHATTKLQNEVVAQTRRLSAVIDNVVDGIITIDEGGIIESFNPAATEIFGYSNEEIIGQSVNVLMSESERSKHDENIHYYVNHGSKRKARMGNEVIGLRKDGSTFPLEMSVNDLLIDDTRYFVGIARDITERKRIEQMQKEFISTVSHELRTPLTSIRGSLGLILGGIAGELPEKAKSLLTITNNNSERLIHLINDILDIEKITAGKMHFNFAVTDLISVLQQAVESNKGYADRLNVRFALDAGTNDELMVRIDEKRMGQVMANLLSNAAKHSPADDQVDISVTTSKEHVRICVHDHGKGIPEEFKSRVFSKFAQADSSDTRQKGGTGLGLSITKAIVEQHSGNIGFDSSEGMGTTFHVELPLWHKDEEHGTDEANNEGDLDKPLLLIVEDDHDVSKLLSILLEKEGYRTHQAYDYPDAKQKLRENQYSAITLDLVIPGGSGIDLLHELRDNEATRELPVIVVSASPTEGILEIGGDAFNMADWIEKPIDEDMLLSSVRASMPHATAECGRILHVEDDPDIAMVVSSALGEEFTVINASTLKHAKQLVSNETFALVLLDISLPDGSGLDLLPTLNSPERQIPVIIFSAQDVGPEIAVQVKSILLKSKTDNERLIQQIKSAMNKKT
ncbi:MAG: response regulator [Candidatus Thiodiazotropha sp. (ex Dulcina madagascariensis)]|nr:response regulator [Candidatus Thiodiazotropha sp. (ex Dulcina madagascariensis)]